MEDFNSETDSDYTSYWRDWVGRSFLSSIELPWTARAPFAFLFVRMVFSLSNNISIRQIWISFGIAVAQ